MLETTTIKNDTLKKLSEKGLPYQSYSVALDLIKEAIKNHEIIVIDGKGEYNFMKKALPKNVTIVKNKNDVSKPQDNMGD